MKKLICFFLAVLVLVSPALAADGDTIVYTTRTGECYHRRSCSSLSKSCYETTLAEAVADGYRPCGRCHPPTLDAGASSKSALDSLLEEKIAENNRGSSSSFGSSSGSSYSGYSSGSSSYSSGYSSDRSSSRASASSSRSEVSPLLKIGRILFAVAVLYPIWVPIVISIQCAFKKLFKKE